MSAPSRRPADYAALAGLELKAATVGLTPAERRGHEELALRLATIHAETERRGRL